MSFKAIFFVLFVLILGGFVYLKFQVAGNPNSSFNQSTRFVLGKKPLVRTLLGLHNPGDARRQYFSNTGPLVIAWFKPQTEDIDDSVVKQFAELAGKYTGRQTSAVFGGAISTGNVDLQTLGNLSIKAPHTPAGATALYVAFVTDYKPIASGELSTTLGETTVVISLNAHRQFLGDNQRNLNNYLLSSLLHEFGHEMGLNHNSNFSPDPSCIMNEHAGINGQPLEYFGNAIPKDFCEAEVKQINTIKESLK